jgi:hypothetical protein
MSIFVYFVQFLFLHEECLSFFSFQIISIHFNVFTLTSWVIVTVDTLKSKNSNTWITLGLAFTVVFMLKS